MNFRQSGPGECRKRFFGGELTINEDCCQPPLRRHEVARIARSIGRLKPQKHSGDQKLPLIDAGNGDLEEITEQALAAVLDANDPPHLFRQGGIPVRLERDDEDRIITTAITPNRLRQFLASTCRFFKDSTKAGQYTVHPPMPVVHNILATPDLPLPVLRRITECPIFLIDGTLHEPTIRLGSTRSRRSRPAPTIDDPGIQTTTILRRRLPPSKRAVMFQVWHCFCIALLFRVAAQISEFRSLA